MDTASPTSRQSAGTGTAVHRRLMRRSLVTAAVTSVLLMGAACGPPSSTPHEPRDGRRLTIQGCSSYDLTWDVPNESERAAVKGNCAGVFVRAAVGRDGTVIEDRIEAAVYRAPTPTATLFRP
jgi:hypothetical protein